MGLIKVRASKRARAYVRKGRDRGSSIAGVLLHRTRADVTFTRMSKAKSPSQFSRAKTAISANLHHARQYRRDLEAKFLRGKNKKLFSNSGLYRKLMYGLK